MKRPSREPSTLSDTVHYQLNMYALAASAAGVGVLAFVQPSEAKIVYTKIHHVMKANSKFDLDLNHDGVTDFVIVKMKGWVGWTQNSLYCEDAPGNAVVGRSNTYHSARALKSGARIGPGRHFTEGRSHRERMAVVWRNDTAYGSSGYWRDVANRYLGLKFKVHGKAHYGWARLTVQLPGFPVIKATLTGYAYETVPNKPIITGKTKGPDVITLEPGSLGRLARGAARRLGE